MPPYASVGGYGSRVLRALLIAAVVIAIAPATAGAKTKWLCKPGLTNNPCDMRMDVARFSPDGRLLGRDDPKPARRRVDCFYVYPTVSDQPTATANRRIDPELRSIVRYQAARYGRTCRVFAPVYEQVTLAGLSSASPGRWEHAYRDVRAAWRDYLAHENRGRGVVLIGHSQGTFHLRDLIAREIENRPSVRRRLISAILLGGNVTVARDRDVGGDFRRVRACHTPTQIGCVVAFSTFNGPVPPDAIFGRTSEPGREVLCTNPAALGGGEAAVDPVVPREPFAPGTAIAVALGAVGFPVPATSATWLSFPDNFRARCIDDSGANVLQITGSPALTPVPAPTWGLHLTDGNIALGNLEELVRSQARAYLRAR
jgi:Protein of unknown function (DUF3089)